MKRRIASMLILIAVVVAQLAAARAAVAIQESSSGVTVTEIGRGTHLRLHRFDFAPGGAIDQQTILEPMLVEVLGGSFVFYIPESEGDTITFYGEVAPFAVDSTNCPVLPLQQGPQECTFDDQPSATELQCDPTGVGFECQVLNTVGILVQPGTTLVLPGPTECMVCKLNANAGKLEVAVVEPPGGATWWNAVPNEGGTPAPVSTPAAKSAPAIAGKATLQVDPCTGLLR